MLGQKKSISNKEDFIKSIDALFLKLELAYHYQFYKVFGTDEKLKEGKKLWAISLKDIAPEIILDAVENVISSIFGVSVLIKKNSKILKGIR